MDLADIDQAKRKELFEKLNFVAAGEPMVEVMCAMQDLFTALICLVANDKANAKEIAEGTSRDIIGSIDSSYDFYRNRVLSQRASKAKQ